MILTRRQFLAAALPAALILPELVVPNRTFFLPPAGGWVRPSLADLWLNYANRIRPCGIAVSTLTGVRHFSKPWVGEAAGGRVILSLPVEVDAETERKMRLALTMEPIYDGACTARHFIPWEPYEPPAAVNPFSMAAASAPGYLRCGSTLAPWGGPA